MKASWLSETVPIPAGEAMLHGDLVVPDAARGLVLFAHGSGSSRHSPRNRFVARVLQEGGLATLLLDLLTPEEESLDLRTAALRFDIGFLAGRLLAATGWLGGRPETQQMRVGYFGASTGGAAALVAAAKLPRAVRAVVSRGGRPDLAGPYLPEVQAPVLLIVGGDDTPVLELNRQALSRLRARSRLEIIPGATHLFEEAGALERVADRARDWFEQYLVREPAGE
jgi:putative phosphoribosyl transferase